MHSTQDLSPNNFWAQYISSYFIIYYFCQSTIFVSLTWGNLERVLWQLLPIVLSTLELFYILVYSPDAPTSDVSEGRIRLASIEIKPLIPDKDLLDQFRTLISLQNFLVTTNIFDFFLPVLPSLKLK